MSVDQHEFTGNLGRDPELRYTKDGKAVCTFSIGNTPRRNVNGQWQDGVTLWLRVTAWDTLAENIAASITKGTNVKVTGTLSKPRPYTDPKTNQEKQGDLEITADDVSVSLRNQKLQGAPVKSSTARNGGSSGGNSGASYGSGYNAPAATVADEDVPF